VIEGGGREEKVKKQEKSTKGRWEQCSANSTGKKE